jgi:hypothetical protein
MLVLAEIYPSIWGESSQSKFIHKGLPIKDANQVARCVEWMKHSDHCAHDPLAKYLAMPYCLGVPSGCDILNEEGWILGV